MSEKGHLKTSKEPFRNYATSDRSPLRQMMAATGVSAFDISYVSKLCLKSIGFLLRNDDRVYEMRIKSLVRVALALGCAPVELMPELGRRPRRGLLHKAGYYSRTRAEKRSLEDSTPSKPSEEP